MSFDRCYGGRQAVLGRVRCDKQWAVFIVETGLQILITSGDLRTPQTCGWREGIYWCADSIQRSGVAVAKTLAYDFMGDFGA